MIQLPAIVDGQTSIMLTGHSIEEAWQSCRDRFGARFEGFGPIPTATKARAKWAEYQDKKIGRQDLEAWLAEQDDESEIRELFKEMRAG